MPVKRPPTKTLCACLAAALAVAACKTSPPASGASSSTTGDYAMSCVQGALLGAAAGALVEIYQGRKSGQSSSQALKGNTSALAKAAAAGCAIGLAATAIGKYMDSRQQAQHEEAMQREARRRALEQQTYTSTQQRLQTAPVATPAQRTARDAELERARLAYQASIAQPVTVDLGKGGTSTIQVQPPVAPPAGQPAPPPTGCTDYSVLVSTPAGKAKQFETWCPNASGQMVRTEAREAPVA